jgi:hypothetical protein
VRTLFARLPVSKNALIRKIRKQSSGNPEMNTAQALHNHISMIEGKCVFQAKQ